MSEDDKPNIYPNLNDRQFRLNKISEVRDCRNIKCKF